MDQLQVLGWEVLVLWECEIRALRGVQERIVAFMNQDAHALSRPLDV
ncbi:hypothetical protein R77564_03270 [Ralstonia sp. LMG 32965]|uniref:Very short patch repair endonuclease n=2 Tax=Ralstonia flatus TaxID=3058601 RepID=A0ABN9KDI5_9RALS|nr:hypothetical protein R77564_03270 [Ralstonia sp. LMG 32965]